MRLLMIGDGTGTIPPAGRGALQMVIWDYATRLRARGHEVEIANIRKSRIPYLLPGILRGRGFDWVWTHHDPSVPWVQRLVGRRHVHLSHRPVTDPRMLSPRDCFHVRRAARAPFQFCLTPEIRLVNKVTNPLCEQALLPNGVAVEDFRIAEVGKGAVCVGGIGRRKRQRLVMEAGTDCDYIGPIDDKGAESDPVLNSDRYRGVWTRGEMHQGLTKYAALVLFSRSEAQPLVVGEAFAAGLSVVLSPESAINVDRSLPWVTIVREPGEIPGAVAAAAARNGEFRTQIREYAWEQWDWSGRVDAVEKYLGEWSGLPVGKR